ncbi:MAG: hypothetical protein ACQUHE_18355, partial [Bacteroidia bacterium]
GECLQTLEGRTYDVDFSPDGEFIAIGSENEILIFKNTSQAWLLRNNITATLSPLLADGAILRNTIISPKNRLIMMQRGASIEGCGIIDDTCNPTDVCKVRSETNNYLDEKLCQDFLNEKHISKFSRDFKLVSLTSTQSRIEEQKPETSAEVYIVDKKHIDRRPSHCCELM